MDPEAKRKDLEIKILTIIEQKLTKGQMDLPRAKAIARMLLERLHPPLTLEQLYQVAPTLDDEFSELTSAVLPLMQEHESVTKQVVLEHATKMLRSGKFDEAMNTLKQG